MNRIRKTLVAILTVVVTAGPWVLKAMNVIPGTEGTAIATLVSTVLGLAAIVLHYLVPNTTTDPAVAATQSVKLVGPSAIVAAPSGQ